MNRRRFDHFYMELCCALGLRLHRYALWLELRQLDTNPETLGRDALLVFFEKHLDTYLAQRRMSLNPRSRRRLRRTLERYDPEVATHYEFMERMADTRTS